MAESPSHRFGQIIGDVLEGAIHEPLAELCRKCNLYLDSKHPRAARRGRSKVSWKDAQGNSHDLDYVIESGGSEDAFGSPRAFLEIAWRRYTKHSRNKVQEIQGAILPLAEAYQHQHPFLGAILAGVFTEVSLNQLRSHGFRVLYFPYLSIISAFSSGGIDADFDESTPDLEFAAKVSQFQGLSRKRRQRIVQSLRNLHALDLQAFFDKMEVALKRQLSVVFVLPLHGRVHELPDAESAIVFLQQHRQNHSEREFVRYEIIGRYSNGDEIRGMFQTKDGALDFLNSLKSSPPV